jgi:Flp pilus assembly protein TadD
MDRKWRIAALIAAVLFIYGQTGGFGFLNYDDDAYVTGNSHVLKGLAGESIAWAWQSVSKFYWHPLTWLSLMTNVQFFGPSAGSMHVANLMLHGAAAVVLYLALLRLTGKEGRSFTVAALFAVHPLRVESVAWVAERKDVLCGLLMVGTFWAYERYVRLPSRSRYGTVIGLFAAACLAKPMAVIVPVLLLILDWWPLRRRAFLEKIPFVVIAAGIAVLTYVGQREMGALAMVEPTPIPVRLQNATWSVGQYLRQTFVPTGFSIIYPYSQQFPGFWGVAVALMSLTGLAVWQRRSRPWILAGWLWFVIGLLPTLGLIQAGVQARADRFTYIPQIGLLIAVVWLTAEFVPQRVLEPVGFAAVAVLAFVSYQQTSAWRSSETVFAQAVRNTSNNWLAEHKYALALLERRDVAGAETHLRRAAALNRTDPHTPFHLGLLLAARGRAIEAEHQFAEAARLKPDYADAHYSRATMLAQLGKPSEALAAFERAMRIGMPLDWEYQGHLQTGVILAQTGRIAEAEKHFRSALAIQPNSLEARRLLTQAEGQRRGEKPIPRP